jgi:SNF2 family DNA or RNA helicase
MLVFSQFTSLLALVSEALAAEGIAHGSLTGETPSEERRRLVDDFQGGRFRVFLLSLKAGGSGLNLTAADTVFLLDPWWNPAAEDQAADRAHRLGQTQPVTVVRLVALGTVEEKVLELHTKKRELVRGVLEGADLSAKVSVKELVELLRA